MPETLVVLDFGSQYSQLITRRVREAQVYAELVPWNASKEMILELKPAGFILSGGPYSVYEPDAPALPELILASGLPVLGICYGMQTLVQTLGGVVIPAGKREYGLAVLENIRPSMLISVNDNPHVWMSHGDRIEQMPGGFEVIASTANSLYAAIADEGRGYYGLQFHPEVHHTPAGKSIIKRFIREVCGCRGDWTPQSMIAQAINQIAGQVGDSQVLSAVSGGVDSSVATALVQRAVGSQLTAIFVDTGFMREGESDWVERAFRQNLGDHLIIMNAKETFFRRLSGVTSPEEKRRIIGEIFIRQFESTALELGKPPFLVQGTIYPDVIESKAPEQKQAHTIKTHHNVGGLPEEMEFRLVEPLRFLFKDEVRLVGEALGLPPELVWRQPFPGPGLAVRCLGELTLERVEKLRQADAIFTDELAQAGLLIYNHGKDEEEKGSAQAFAVLLPVKAVGVMGDQRSYEEVIALRAVTTEDFMTADWSRLPYDLLARVANRIVNEVKGVNRVAYDITSKPPGTIEWE